MILESPYSIRNSQRLFSPKSIEAKKQLVFLFKRKDKIKKEILHLFSATPPIANLTHP